MLLLMLISPLTKHHDPGKQRELNPNLTDLYRVVDLSY